MATVKGSNGEGDAADRLSDVVYFGIGKRGDVGLGGTAGHGIDLDQTDRASFVRNLAQTIAEGVNLFVIRPHTVNPHKEALDHHGATPGRVEDVIQDLLEGNGGHIHQVIVLLGPRIEFRPDLAVMAIQQR